jgi:anti-anti-sigma factor
MGLSSSVLPALCTLAKINISTDPCEGVVGQISPIVLDLGDVTHIDSGGLGTLVSLYASARKVGGDIKLAHIGNHTRELLQITRLVTLFEIFHTVEDAIASFEKAVAAR